MKCKVNVIYFTIKQKEIGGNDGENFIINVERYKVSKVIRA